MYRFESSITIVKIPAGRNGNPKIITSLITFDFISARLILFITIGTERKKIIPETSRFEIKTPSIVLIGYFFFGTYVIQLPGVYAKEITTWIPIFRAIGAISNISLNILLIPKYGVLGSAWATAISFVIMSLSVFIKLFNVYYVKYNLRAILYPILFMIIIFSSLQSFFVKVFTGFIYWVGWYFLAISKSERTIIKDLLN